MNADIPDDRALTLKDACAIYFRDAIKPASLRAEARKGTLRLMRIGRTDFVTPAAIRDMMKAKECQGNASPQGSTSATTNKSGLSETERDHYAQAAALATAEALKRRSQPTSGRSTTLSSAKVVRLDSR